MYAVLFVGAFMAGNAQANRYSCCVVEETAECQGTQNKGPRSAIRLVNGPTIWPFIHVVHLVEEHRGSTAPRLRYF